MLKVLKLISCTVFLFAINFSCAVPQTSEAGDYLTSAREFELCAEWEQAGLMLDQWARLNPVDDSWQQRRLRCADGAGDRQTSMRIRRQLLALDAGDLALRIDLADDLQAYCNTENTKPQAPERKTELQQWCHSPNSPKIGQPTKGK